MTDLLDVSDATKNLERLRALDAEYLAEHPTPPEEIKPAEIAADTGELVIPDEIIVPPEETAERIPAISPLPARQPELAKAEPAERPEIHPPDGSGLAYIDVPVLVTAHRVDELHPAVDSPKVTGDAWIRLAGDASPATLDYFFARALQLTASGFTEDERIAAMAAFRSAAEGDFQDLKAVHLVIEKMRTTAFVESLLTKNPVLFLDRFHKLRVLDYAIHLKSGVPCEYLMAKYNAVVAELSRRIGEKWVPAVA